MIILDTNVVSELVKPRPDPNVEAWIARQSRDVLFLTSITVAEVLYGLARMDEGRRKQSLVAEIELLFAKDFEGLVIPFDEAAARLYGLVASRRWRVGRHISELDMQMASIAAVHDAIVATRNVTDFEHCGINVINPWEDE